MTQWHIIYNGQQIGPMSAEQLKSYGLNPHSKVWHEGLPDWVEAYTIPELMCVMRPTGPGCPPPYTGSSSNNYVPTSDKNRVAAGILAIVLGSLGVQYFYLGKIAGGFLTILLCVATCGVWNLINIVQGILMLTMTDEQFEQKYVYSTSVLPLF